MSISGLKSSGDSPHSRLQAFLAAAALTVVAAAAVFFFYSRDYILYYGDAQSHLNIARELVDARVHGYNRIGTVWLPVLHLLCAPFAASDWLWSTGLAGSIPVAACFILAGTCFFLAARQVYASALAGFVVIACLALNPNILYLASIPMTEQVFTAGVAVLLLALVRYRTTQMTRYVVLGTAALWAMCLTRFDGWFLIPFTALWFAGYSQSRKKRIAFVVACAGCVPALYWMGNSWWLTGNALDFYNGPYSAMAIQGGRPYPGFHNWAEAVSYYTDAAKLCAGLPLLVIGAIGCACSIASERFSPLGFLYLTPLFYIWSIHSSGNPVYGPRYFGSYYNTRYACALVVAAAFASGAIVEVLGRRRRLIASLLPVVAVLPWLLRPGEEHWICWKESQVNSVARRAWTAEGASYLEHAYGRGEGILTSAGDVTGIYCRARIPLRETLDVADVPEWYGASVRPRLAYDSGWAVAQEGDILSKSLHSEPEAYQLLQRIEVKGAPALEVYRRRTVIREVQ